MMSSSSSASNKHHRHQQTSTITNNTSTTKHLQHCTYSVFSAPTPYGSSSSMYWYLDHVPNQRRCHWPEQDPPLLPSHTFPAGVAVCMESKGDDEAWLRPISSISSGSQRQPRPPAAVLAFWIGSIRPRSVAQLAPAPHLSPHLSSLPGLRHLPQSVVPYELSAGDGAGVLGAGRAGGASHPFCNWVENLGEGRGLRMSPAPAPGACRP